MLLSLLSVAGSVSMSYMRVDVAHHDRPAALNITTPQIQLSHDDLVQVGVKQSSQTFMV